MPAALRVEPFREELLADTARLCGRSLALTARRLRPVGVERPGAPAGRVAADMLRRYLDADDRLAWVALDGARVRAFAGVTLVDLAPDDPRYTYMPPRAMTMPATAWHVESGRAAAACLPLFLGKMRRSAMERGIPRLLVGLRPADTGTTAVWRRLGFRPDVMMAARPVGDWQPVALPPQITLRPASEEDVEALTDMALEEHLYHAHHTSTGTSPDQPRETSRRIAAEAVAAAPDTTCQLVAERAATAAAPARVIGSAVGTVERWEDDDVRRFVLPQRYGYVGLTAVTADARGHGVGRALVDGLMQWFATAGVRTAFLHYVMDNQLSASFWTHLGFAAWQETVVTLGPFDER